MGTNFKAIQEEWANSGKNLVGAAEFDCGDPRREYWNNLIRPESGGFFQAVVQAIEASDESTLRNWLSGPQKLPAWQEFHHNAEDELFPVFQTHLACALVVIAAKEAETLKITVEQIRAATVVGRPLDLMLRAAWMAATLSFAKPDAALLNQLLEELLLEIPNNAFWPADAAKPQPPVTAKHFIDCVFRLPHMIKAAEEARVSLAFLRDMARKLINAPRKVVRACTVAFAVAQTGSNEEGALVYAEQSPTEKTPQPNVIQAQAQVREPAILLQFTLELLPDGRGEIFLSPAQSYVKMDQKFCELFEKNFCRLFDFHMPVAPATTNGALVATGSQRYDVRVSVKYLDGERDGQLIGEPLKGNSGTGAAARGVWFLLNNKVPDEGVIVVARIDPEGNLYDVAHVPEKAQAIAESRRFDTIVVASDTNETEATAKLDALIAAGSIQVGSIRVVNLCKSEVDARSSNGTL